MTLTDLIVEHLNKLGGHAHLSELYDSISNDPKANIQKYKDLRSFKASIRAQIEMSSSDSERYRGKEDIFYSTKGLGNGEWGLRKPNLQEELDITSDDSNFIEGRKKLRIHMTRDRNHYATTKAKEYFKNKNGHLYCEICGFDFEKRYGILGKDFIEAHHIIPISEIEDERKINIEDFVMLCSNCHSMIHRKRPWLTRENLLELLKKDVSKK